MKDPARMTKIEKYRYIFALDPNRNNEIRFDWISHGLLGDIQTFLDGVENFIQNKGEISDNLPRGGGNLSVAILVNTGLEFVSALYIGKTEYKDGKNYNATENVKEFIAHFFPNSYKEIPLLLWDGIRNGIVHTFSPKPFEYQQNYIRFQFFVEDQNVPAHVTKVNNIILIRINSFELYQLLKKVIEDYRAELEKNENLQDKFILAWSSIEEYTRNINHDVEKSNEVEILLSKLKKSNSYSLLQ